MRRIDKIIDKAEHGHEAVEDLNKVEEGGDAFRVGVDAVEGADKNAGDTAGQADVPDEVVLVNLPSRECQPQLLVEHGQRVHGASQDAGADGRGRGRARLERAPQARAQDPVCDFAHDRDGEKKTPHHDRVIEKRRDVVPLRRNVGLVASDTRITHGGRRAKGVGIELHFQQQLCMDMRGIAQTRPGAPYAKSRYEAGAVRARHLGYGTAPSAPDLSHYSLCHDTYPDFCESL